jgi:glycosyltransferase involved in cell wall biosynthesis
LDTESKAIRGEACATAACKLREKGFYPDLICGHAGWGETLFLKDVFPQSKLLTYQEFFYNQDGFDSGFDHEYSQPDSWESRARTRMKTVSQMASLQASDWCITPTNFQHSSFPAAWKQRISVIHDGIDVSNILQAPANKKLELDQGRVFTPDQQIITFVNRRVEPYRGCHTFIRAIPDIHQQNPQAEIVVVGSLKGVSYGRPCPEGEWVDHFMAEIKGCYDAKRLHFVGHLDYPSFLHLLRLSKAHVYLTYPFVLSWSLLEAMAAGCPIIGSRTAPVQEVIRDGKNGILVDFFSPKEVADAVNQVLREPGLSTELGRRAHLDIINHYSLQKCLPRHLALMELVAKQGLPLAPN